MRKRVVITLIAVVGALVLEFGRVHPCVVGIVELIKSLLSI